MPFSSLGRLRQITSVVARHGLGHYLDRRRAKQRGESPEQPSTSATAVRFRAVLTDLGPTFIKFGQVLSTRADLLPPGFAEVLSELQDHCPPMSQQETAKALRQGLGRPPEELFRELDSTPIASASIAQVHRAVTMAGDEVAVKIQRLAIRDKIIRDLDILYLLAQLVEAIVEESGIATPRDIVAEFEEAFLGELDFKRELWMMQRFYANAAGKDRTYVVPKVYEELSSSTVLTMEFLHGSRLSELKPQHDPKQIAANIVRASFEQLFVDGLFHADPHPGNFLVLDDNRLALLDFGCVSELSYTMRETLVVLVVAVGMRDAETVARVMYRIGKPAGRVSLYQLRDACASLFARYLHDQTTLANVEAAQLLQELLNLAARFRVRMPSDFSLISRASVLVEGGIRYLDPQLDVLKTAGPYVKALIEEQFTLPDLGDSALKGMIQARSMMRELPLMTTQILMDLESGKLQLQVDSPKLDQISRRINGLGITVFLGLVVSALIVGALSMLTRYDFELGGVPVLPTVALSLAALLSGIAIGRYVVAPRVRKLSVGRALRRRRRRGR